MCQIAVFCLSLMALLLAFEVFWCSFALKLKCRKNKPVHVIFTSPAHESFRWVELLIKQVILQHDYFRCSEASNTTLEGTKLN